MCMPKTVSPWTFDYYLIWLLTAIYLLNSIAINLNHQFANYMYLIY